MTRLQWPNAREGAVEANVDLIKSFGEDASAMIVADKLRATYVSPEKLLVVSSDFGNARILPESEERIWALSLDDVIVVPGFFGYTRGGEVATFSRGGSDLTGAYIAAALGAEVYENYTDSGIAAAFPFVDNPRTIDELTFDEMRDLSYSGFRIFHPEAMGPVARRGIPVHVRGFRSYPEKGTYIVGERVNGKNSLVGVAYQEGFSSINISRFGMNEEKGILRHRGYQD